MEKCLTIRVDHRESLSIKLDGSHYVHVIGVASGSLWASAASPVENGAFTSYRWDDKAINYPGSVTIGLSSTSLPTPPTSSRSETVGSLEKKMEEQTKELKQFEEKAKSRKITNTEPAVLARKKSIRAAKVLLNGKLVFEITGEHIQFQINQKQDKGCYFTLFALASDTDTEPVGKYHEELSQDKEFLVRFGS